MSDEMISKQDALHALCKAVHKGGEIPCPNQTSSCLWRKTRVCDYAREIDALPPDQSDESIPIAWINEKIRLIEESGAPLLRAKAADYRDLIAQWKVEQANQERNYNEEIRKIAEGMRHDIS